MWEKLRQWARGAFMNNQDIQSMDIISLGSSDMRIAQTEWIDLFYNEPYWKKGKEKTTKMAAVVSDYIATLATSELKLSVGSNKRSDWIKKQIENEFLPSLHDAVQKAIALSYTVVKPIYENGSIYFDIYTPNTFIPTQIVGQTIIGGVFITESEQNGNVYTRYENHYMNGNEITIKNTVYKKGSKNYKVQLSQIEKWKELKEEITVTSKYPLFSVISMPFSNQIDPESKLPVSIFANAMDSFEAIDRIYNDFLYEVESSRRKMIFNNQAVKLDDKPVVTDLRSFKTTDEYLVLNAGLETNEMFADYSPTIRIEEYQNSLNLQMRIMERQVGVSSGTFDFDLKTGGAITATEVIAKRTDTYSRIKSIQIDGMKQGLIQLIYACDTMASLYKLTDVFKETEIEPVIEFGDSVFEDTGVEFLRRKSLVDSGLLRKEEFVGWYFGVSPETAKDMMPEEKEEDSEITFGTNTYD